MGQFSGWRHSYGISVLALFFLLACTADEGPLGADLDKVLTREKARSLAAAKMGKAGGTLQITEGEYAGTMLVVPPGALQGDAVLSIYAGTPVEEKAGYRPVGPAIRLAATTPQLRADAVLTLPFAPDSVSEASRSSLAFLRQADGRLSTVAGAAFFDGFARAAVREFSDYAVVLDMVILLGDPALETPPPRCPVMTGGISLQAAISSTRFMAQMTLADTEEEVLKAHSLGADGCGYSQEWEVVWYSVAGNDLATIQVGPGGVSDPLTGVKPACATTANAFRGSGNSTLLSDDLAQRLGSTPASLNISIRACNDSVPADPSRIRLEIPADSNFIEYSADGVMLQKSF